MLSSEESNNRRGYIRRFCTFAFVVAIAGLTLMALMSAPATSSAGRKSPEKTNPRIRQGAADVPPVQSQGRLARNSGSFGAVALLVSIDVDRTDDAAAASACTAAPNDCSLRGAIAFANVNPATTINVPAGTYNLTISGAGEGFSGNNSIGDLDITGNNTAIVGAGSGTTIINQTTAGDRVIEVNPFLAANFSTSISGVTISGGRESTGVGGGGIISGSIGNVLTLTDCIISGNSATGAGSFGGGGVSHEGGSLTIIGCTFSGNSTSTSGGAIGYTAGDPLIRTPSPGTLLISGSTFSGNSAASSSAGGGAADLFDFNGSVGTYTINSSTFSGNTATNGSGGAIIVESGPLTLATSSLTTNTAAIAGGAIFSSGSVTNVSYSRLVGNTSAIPANGLTLFRSSGTFTADDNWWGVNSGPAANDFRQSGATSVTPASWLQLQANASPGTICTGASSTINADIKQRNTGGPNLTIELNGLPAFPASFVDATPALGSVSGASANFVNGAATATFTASNAGTASVDVTADNQTVSASIEIQTNTTSDPADAAVCEGQTANFSTTASGPGPITFVWKKGSTVLNNGDLGGRVTITNGATTSTLSISNTQASDGNTYTVEATGACSTAIQSATLTVNTPTSTTDPADQSVCQGATANFSTTAGGTGPFHYAWTLDGSPFNGDSPSISVPTGPLSQGVHTVAVTTTGTCGTASQSATLTVQSNTPTITVGNSSISIWPPNHQYQTFNLSNFNVTASSCGGGPTNVVITSVTSDELDNNPSGADGNTVNDIVIAADCKSIQLRRERDGDLNGRVYTITFRVTDSFGNTATATATVTVPLNQGGGGAVGGPALNTVNGTCP